jgi:hypothetical protein
MTAHRTLQDDLIAEFEMIDPGDAGTISVDRSPATLNIVSGGVETRVLGVPPAVGLVLTLCLKTDGGTVTVTQTSGAFNQAGNTSAPFADEGDIIQFVSVDIGGTLYWRIVVNDGVTLA